MTKKKNIEKRTKSSDYLRFLACTSSEFLSTQEGVVFGRKSTFVNVVSSTKLLDLSPVMRKPNFCICENKGAD